MSGHSTAHADIPTIVQAPSPSVASSRRTSSDTQTRSSTVSSPALGPVPTTSTGSLGPSANARRNRAALRDFYGLRNPPAQADRNDSRGHENEAEVRSSELDEAGFDAKVYVREILGRESLENLLKHEGSLVSDIKSLDGDRKALVYDNYSKLITATETIRKMRANMDPLTPTTSTLAPAISHIADTAEKLTESRATVRQISTTRKNNVNGIDSEAQQKQLATVKWVCSAPARYRACIAKGDREVAEKDWQQVEGLLGTWRQKQVAGVEDLVKACEEALKN